MSGGAHIRNGPRSGRFGWSGWPDSSAGGDEVDVAVVGAGPAGSAAALRVLQRRPDASVVLLDPGAFPRDKTCGDGLAAPVFDLLDALGVPQVAALCPDVPRLYVRSPGGAVVDAVCSRPNRVLPREVFDAVLVDAALRRGAQLRRRRVRRVEVRPGRVVLDGELSARVVIGADGANSVVRRAMGVRPAPARAVAVAVRGYTRTAMADPDTLRIVFSPGRRAAYAWSFPLPDGRANVGYGVFGRDADTTRARLLERLAEELPGVEPDPDTVRGHLLPLSTGPRPQPDGRVLLAGDAAHLVNPVTGEGIYYALASGALAGQAAALGAGAGAAYRRSLHRALGAHHRHVAALARLVAHERFADAAVAAAAHDPRVFSTVVEVGLGRGTVGPRALAAVARRYLRG